MKVFLLLTVCLVCHGTVYGGSAEGALQLSIAVPHYASRHSEGRREVGYPARYGHFHVLLTNVSEETQRVWTEGCSLGWELLSFELTDDRGKTWVATKRPKGWLRNFAQWWELKPHESVVLNVEFADPKLWEGFPKARNNYGASPKVINMRAVYQIPESEASKAHSIWTGRIVSKREQYLFPYE